MLLRPTTLGVAVVLVALTGCMAEGIAWGQDGAGVPVCCVGPPPALEQTMGTLAVTVRLTAGGGAPPPPGMEPAGPQQLGGAGGVTIQALPSDTASTVAAEAVTDAQGQATLTVSSGRYWVIVPVVGQQNMGAVAGALASELPSGVRVHASREVSVGAAETVPVTLGLMIMLP